MREADDTDDRDGRHEQRDEQSWRTGLPLLACHDVLTQGARSAFHPASSQAISHRGAAASLRQAEAKCWRTTRDRLNHGLMEPQPEKPYWVGEPLDGITLAPLPRRPPLGVWVQYVLQPLWVPLLGLLNVVLVVMMLAAGGGDLPGRSIDSTTGRWWTSRRKLRLELHGDTAAWRAWAEERLAEAFARSTRIRTRKDPDRRGPTPVVTLAPRDRRLLSAADVAQLARGHGWVIVWKHLAVDTELYLVPRAECHRPAVRGIGPNRRPSAT